MSLKGQSQWEVFEFDVLNLLTAIVSSKLNPKVSIWSQLFVISIISNM